MRRLASVVLLLPLGALAASGSGQVAPPPGEDPALRGVSGAYAYRTYCASCHGTDGKGEGPLAESLRFRPPDLTLIAKRHGGTYPADKVQRIVDGRDPLDGHGGPDMPIWGDAFRNPDTGYDNAQVKERIRAVVDFLRTLQAK